MSAPLLIGPGVVARTIRVPKDQVAWVRWVVEAHDGLANLHFARGGRITLVTPESQADALDEVIADLAEEIPLERLSPT
ncbi:MAG TPA: DUF4911 domain-containing protein [Sandaracinaceae bacterium LLY-WYZ-13_1]|nr:DUF4911 domain-containing protein [Sandaracinaceae bacterium LLY-WYZ-13_1]